MKNVDGSFLFGKIFGECLENVTATVKILRKKSFQTPTQKKVFLEFVKDSIKMTMSQTG